jgi:hypothetical protein
VFSVVHDIWCSCCGSLFSVLHDFGVHVVEVMSVVHGVWCSCCGSVFSIVQDVWCSFVEVFAVDRDF